MLLNICSWLHVKTIKHASQPPISWLDEDVTDGMLVRPSSCLTLWVGAVKRALLFSRSLTRCFPGGSLQFLCWEGISPPLTTQHLLFCSRKCSKNVALQVFWCCVTRNALQSVLQGMLHLFSAAVFLFSFPISLASWLLTTGLYPDNLWMTTFTCTAMLSRQLHFSFLLKAAFDGCFLD